MEKGAGCESPASILSRQTSHQYSDMNGHLGLSGSFLPTHCSTLGFPAAIDPLFLQTLALMTSQQSARQSALSPPYHMLANNSSSKLPFGGLSHPLFSAVAPAGMGARQSLLQQSNNALLASMMDCKEDQQHSIERLRLRASQQSDTNSV